VQLPDVPAVNETLPGYEVTNWFGMVVPAATPKDIVARLHAEIVRVLRISRGARQPGRAGTEPVGAHPRNSALHEVRSGEVGAVIKEANIRAD